MKAVVFHAVGDIRMETVEEPKLRHDLDAIVRLTASALCGTDLHMIRGTMPGMEPGTILGHEGVGVVEETGKGVRNLRRGDRVVIPSTIACGCCSYCRGGYTAQCDNANPNGNQAGTAFFGGPGQTGPFNGLQAEYARIPYANVNLVRLPDEVSDDQAIALSDIAPTGWFGADMADIEPGEPDGGDESEAGTGGEVAALVLAPLAEQQPDALGAEAVDFSRDDPVEAIMELTMGIGTDRAIEAVGVDAYSPEPPRRDGGLGGPPAERHTPQLGHQSGAQPSGA